MIKRLVCLLLVATIGSHVFSSTNATNDGPALGPERSCSSEFNDKTPTSFLDDGDRCPAKPVPEPLPSPEAPAWQVPSIIRFNISEVPITISTKFEEMRNEHAPAIGQFFARYQEEFEDHPNIHWFAVLSLNLLGLLFVILTVISKMFYFGLQWALWKFYSILPVPQHAGRYANKSKFFITSFQSCLPTITWPCMPGVVTWILSLISKTLLNLLAPFLAIAFVFLIAVMVRVLFEMVRARLTAPGLIVPPPPPPPAPAAWTANRIGYVTPPDTHYVGFHRTRDDGSDLLAFPTFVGGAVHNYNDARGMSGVLPTRQEALNGTIWGGTGNGDEGVPHTSITGFQRKWNEFKRAYDPDDSIESFACLREFISSQCSSCRYGNTNRSTRCGHKCGLMFVFLYDVVNSTYWNDMNAIHQEYALNIFLDVKAAREAHVRTQAQIIWRHLQP